MSDKIKPCFVVLEPCTPKAQLALSAELRKVIHERNILTSHTRRKFLSDLDEIENNRYELRRQTKKNHVIQEILDSEVVYLKQLEVIMTYFMKPIKAKKVLSSHEYEVVFGSIESIYQVNGELLNELKENLTNVATAFSKLAPFFKMYSVYAYDYKKCLDMLERLYLTNTEFLKVLTNQETRPEVQAKLSSLLITPIQRIPRYCMLLKQVMEYTLPTDPDYSILKDSLEKLEEVARHVNSLVEDRENSQRLRELLRCLKNDKNLVIQPGRKLIKEGVLTKYTDKKNKEKIYLILMSDIIMCCKIKKTNISLPNSLKCLYIYPLNKCTIEQNHNTKMFEIDCQNEKMILYHEKGTESDVWIKVIDENIRKCVRNRMSLRKGSSSRRPASGNNFSQYLDVGVSPGITRIRKRRRTMEETNDEEENDKVLKLSNDSKTKLNCLPIRLPRRKQNENNSEEKDVSVKKDSLFPLRQHFQRNKVVEENSSVSNSIVPYNPDIYVFGRENNQNRGFSFRLDNVFSTIVSSVKKVFGFK